MFISHVYCEQSSRSSLALHCMRFTRTLRDCILTKTLLKSHSVCPALDFFCGVVMIAPLPLKKNCEIHKCVLFIFTAACADSGNACSDIGSDKNKTHESTGPHL